MTLVDGMQSDTLAFLGDFGQTVTIKRNTPAFSSGYATDVWTTTCVTTADIQPDAYWHRSRMKMEEYGRAAVASVRVFLPIDADVAPGDRIYEGTSPDLDDSCYEIHAVERYPDHLEGLGIKRE